MNTPIVLETNIAGLASPKRGKVRDIYDLGDSLLIVATDRISAFDVVLPNAVPQKGRVLTQISKYWFSKTADIVKNHLLATEVADAGPHVAGAVGNGGDRGSDPRGVFGTIGASYQ